MRKRTFGVAALLLMLAAVNTNATEIGYSKDKIKQTNVFSVGSSTTQGQMIRISKAKLQQFKGKRIDFAEFAVGSKYTTGSKLNVFITTSPDATPIAEGTIDIEKALKKCRWTLPTPYTITGDEEQLYIGYTAEIETNRKLLIADGSYDIPGCNFALKDGEWIDTYGMNRGSAHITVDIEDAPDYTDAIMARSNLDGYFKAGNKYDMTAHFVNAGTTTISSFDAVVKVGSNEQTLHFADLSIAPKDSYSFNLDGVDSSEEGEQPVSVEIANVNGGGESDASDNGIEADVFFYPHDMERSLLLESFTGQDCTQCPSGHLEIQNAIDYFTDTSIVEVAHHAGFMPDMFTMEEDDQCRFYYSSSSTYAPALMVNRNTDNVVGIAPVGNASYNIARQLISHAAQSKPYVSLNLETSFDADTRQLKVKLGILPHTELPTDDVLLNLYLVQDDIEAYQKSGGTEYKHNRVCRGAVTGNSWGISQLKLKPGESKVWEKTITLPEAIHSTYWTDNLIEDVTLADGTVKKRYGGVYDLDQVDIAVVPEKMTVVAYVGEYDVEDNTKNIVFNCCEAPLGGSYRQAAYRETDGIQTAGDESREPSVTVKDGRIVVDGMASGDSGHVSVYSLSGRQIDASAALAPGMYIVKTNTGGKPLAKKILVK